MSTETTSIKGLLSANIFPLVCISVIIGIFVIMTISMCVEAYCRSRKDRQIPVVYYDPRPVSINCETDLQTGYTVDSDRETEWLLSTVLTDRLENIDLEKTYV